jgi:cold shock CspA family protein
MTKLMRETIRSVFPDRRFGFIGGQDSPDIFFHFNDLAEDWYEPRIGDDVEFECVETPKGLRAKSVRKCK